VYGGPATVGEYAVVVLSVAEAVVAAVAAVVAVVAAGSESERAVGRIGLGWWEAEAAAVCTEST